MMARYSLVSLLALATAASAQDATQPTPGRTTTPAAQPAPGVPAAQPAPGVRATPDASTLNARLTAALPADQAAVKAHVMFLASDAMKGREAGSAEFDIAAQYVAAQFYSAGLRPAGDEGGYLQRVPLVAYTLGDGTLAATVGDKPVTLEAGRDYALSANPASAKTQVSGEVVFVGYGLVAPQYRRDDYAGVDVRGKIVAFVGGAPTAMTPEERAYFAQAATKVKIAAEHGAIGAITLATTATPPRGRGAVRTTWANPDGTGRSDAKGTPMLATLTATGGAALLGDAWASIVAQAGKPAPVYTSRAISATLSVDSTTTFTPALSSNVVGVIPGSDPKLRSEVVILSAHLDHIGVRPTGEGDRINNGALDDAIGIASLIEAAKRIRAAPAPRRSVMFLAVTAEEKGLVGSDWFANHPTVPLSSIVADVNLDMPILTYRFEDMVAYGGDRSTLGPILHRALGGIGVTLSPDPNPEQGIFTRSDHFRFVQKGIPSVFLWPGPKGPGKAATEAFMSKCYHRPCDDLTQPILWDQATRFVDANVRIARDIADGADRPVWNKGDYFGTVFNGPMAK